MTDAQGRFRFDADTAAYDAKMAASGHKAQGVGESFADGFKGAIPILGQIATTAGLVGLAVEGIKSAWEAWVERLQAADRISKQLTERLAGVAGGAGQIAQFPALRKGIEGAEGPLTVEQRIGAFGKFAGANPDLAGEHGIAAVQQAQQAALVVGPEGVDRFMHALGIAMRAGLDQKKAGDVALTAAQAGDSGVEALDKLFASYLERFGTEGNRPDFIEYAKNANAEDFGKRGIIGGSAFQGGLKRGITLEGQAALAGNVDPELSRSQRVAGITSQADVVNGQSLGDRAALVRQIGELSEAMRKVGFEAISDAAQRRSAAQGFASTADLRGLGGLIPGESFFDSTETLQKIAETMSEVLEDAIRRANAEHGAPEFRSKAHEEREP